MYYIEFSYYDSDESIALNDLHDDIVIGNNLVLKGGEGRYNIKFMLDCGLRYTLDIEKIEVKNHIITIDYIEIKEAEIIDIKLLKDLSLDIPSIILMDELNNKTIMNNIIDLSSW